jgi:hypothetical protein
MTTCENCGREAVEVWRHREYGESMTHREVRWLCARCHPAMETPVRSVAD